MSSQEAVCDGCWLRGSCERQFNCKCPCTVRGWQHTDDPDRDLTEEIMRPTSAER